jgi:lysosomal acid lipase/cholesteryl ester hydrolase
MRHELPEHRLDIRRLKGYEHLDILWGRNVHVDVIPQVVHALREHCENPEMIKSDADGFGCKATLHPDAANGNGSVESWENGAISDYATSTDG